MPTLDSTLRRKLETAVKAARRAAECGAAKALETLAVGNCLLRKQDQDPALHKKYHLAYELD